MSAYLQRVAASIFPLSENKMHLKAALNEWIFNGKVEDHEQATEICQLCGKQGLRYKFQIDNLLNDNEMWVGSECILRFGVSVADPNKAGHSLSPKAANQLLNKTKNQMIEQGKHNSVLRSLMVLKDTMEQANQAFPLDVSSLMNYYKNNRKFTPKQGALIAWLLRDFKIEHTKSHFKINVQGANKTKLLELNPKQIRDIWEFLTKSQKEIYYRDKGIPQSQRRS